MKIRIHEDGGPSIQFFEGDSQVAGVPLRDARQCIFHLTSALIGVIRAVSHGSPVSGQHIEFVHRASGAMWLVYDIPVGRDARLEFRDYGAESSLGWHDPQTRYRIVHTTSVTPRELADMFRLMLQALSLPREREIKDTDPLFWFKIAEALKIYETEAEKMARDNRSKQLNPNNRAYTSSRLGNQQVDDDYPEIEWMCDWKD